MGEDEAADGIIFLDTELPEGCACAPFSGTLGPTELSRIGHELRQYYDSILREPVPERLLALVDRRLARRAFH
jgi:hypothetical protein